ncbi:hypothetical protein GCM10025857_36710 [Alicyclobacillus contaminans]|uniref:hypothetical protein n=1 Tax=Alicyclobacillus contaminans TaxID=392016 RepID=UPI000429F30E|nr:hypothetical protein [Alicyclobacillus contaminans]GMA52314.1 hypothetical protein GCM10025857_36710 [Alicyclobacillus contaminans]
MTHPKDLIRPVHSRNSGWYNPGPINESEFPNAELSVVQSRDLNILPEEFPEGSYGSSIVEQKLGKTSPWKPGQATESSHRDQNPVTSDDKIPRGERPYGAPQGTIEGQN